MLVRPTYLFITGVCSVCVCCWLDDDETHTGATTVCFAFPEGAARLALALRSCCTHLDEPVGDDEDGAAPDRPGGGPAGRQPLLVEDLAGGKWVGGVEERGVRGVRRGGGDESDCVLCLAGPMLG